jgi:hypothetical protein
MVRNMFSPLKSLTGIYGKRGTNIDARKILQDGGRRKEDGASSFSPSALLHPPSGFRLFYER